MERKIIVFGATGNTGIEICKTLNTLKIAHAAFVRKGSAHKIQSGITDMILGDVLKKADVENTLVTQGYTDIIIALGSRDLKGADIRSNGTKHIVDALSANAQKSKLHVVSAHGVGDSWDLLKWYEKMIAKLFIGKTMKDHELQEKITETNLGGFHIIRPVALKNIPPTGEIFTSADNAIPKGSVSRADLAKYLVESMLDNVDGAHSICNI